MLKIEPGGYIDESVEFLAAIEPAALAQLTMTPEINRGSESSMHALGSLTIGGQEHFVGLKRPLGGAAANTTMRAVREAAFIETIVQRVPALRPAVPHFIGLLAAGEPKNVLGLLTEDATRGGQRPLHPVPMSAEARQLLFEAFDAGDDPYKVFIRSVLDRTIAFDDGHRQRLLDFTPLPLERRALVRTRYPEANEYAWSQLPQLTVTVPADSPLALSAAAG